MPMSITETETQFLLWC